MIHDYFTVYGFVYAKGTVAPIVMQQFLIHGFLFIPLLCVL